MRTARNWLGAMAEQHDGAVTRPCIVSGCGRQHYGNGLCRSHYTQTRLASYKEPPPSIGIPSICSVDNCGTKHYGKGFCKAHYARNRSYGDPVKAPNRKRTLTCSIEGCERAHRCGGLCGFHYSRLRKYGDALADGSTAGRRKLLHCKAPNCTRSINAKGLCSGHYQRLRLYGDANFDVPLRDASKGTINPQGYRIVVVPKGTPNARPQRGTYIMLEHRFVMQNSLARPLTRDETVHHVNGMRSDNRIENLELWVSSHPPGQKVHDHLAWAREIICRYGDLVERSAIFTVKRRAA